MSNNNQVIIERDIFCPYCEKDSAVLISETVKGKKVVGCAPVGLKNGCLLCITGGCWAVICGFPLTDVKEDYTNILYGFCPCCGNSYPVIRPEGITEEATIIDKFQNTKDRFTRVADQAKGLMNKNNDR